MRIRLFKKDGIFYKNFPAPKYQNDTDWDKCKIPNEFIGCERLDLNLDELPQHEYCEQLYHDGEFKKENIKSDLEWNQCVLPIPLIKKKYIDRVNLTIDSELNANVKDPVTILSLQREKEKAIAAKDEEFWHQKALEGLDRRVAGGEPDKPVIRQKLMEKLNK